MRPSLGGTHFPSLNFKSSHFAYWRGGHVTVGILLLYWPYSLSLSRFQPIVVLLVAMSTVLCCCFKAMSLVGILS